MADNQTDKQVSRQVAKDFVGVLAKNRPGLSKEAMLGALVKDDTHLREFLLTIPSGKRREVYLALRPHLNFVPKPFLLLMKVIRG